MKMCIRIACAAVLGVSLSAHADQVIFKNGDKISGKVETLDGGKLKITSKVAGEITVDLKEVATFSTDEPVKIQTADGRRIDQSVTQSTDDSIKAASGEVIELSGIKKLNPAPEKWTGSILVNGAIARGNTNTDDLGVTATGVYRRQNDADNDRLTLNAAYNYGRQKDPVSNDRITTTDNWLAAGKYDRFFSEKVYGYVEMKAEHDRIAELNYRLSPGVGLGYQWFDKPELHFSTEAGVSNIYEDYITDGDDDHVALRLAYHLDKKLNDKVTFFHDVEFLPAFEDPSDYNLTADAGIRTALGKNWFTEFKVQWMRDSTPAPGAEKNDLKYVLSLGYNF